MPRQSAEAIVLRTRPVGEADLIVTFLTEAEGKLEGSARSARRSRRRFGGGLAPLTRGRAYWVEAGRGDLVRLESFEIEASYTERQSELEWFYTFAYLAEVADTFARDREPDPLFFRMLGAAAEASRSDCAPRTVRRWFEVWTLRLQGLLPEMGACSRCGAGPGEGGLAVAVEAGEVLCPPCQGRGGAGDTIPLAPRDLAWISRALASRPERTDDPGEGDAIGRMTRRLLVQFTGRPFRTARFLERP